MILPLVENIYLAGLFEDCLSLMAHNVPSDKVTSRFVHPHKCHVLIAHSDRLGVPTWLSLLSSLFPLMKNG